MCGCWHAQRVEAVSWPVRIAADRHVVSQANDLLPAWRCEAVAYARVWTNIPGYPRAVLKSVHTVVCSDVFLSSMNTLLNGIG